MSIIKKIKNLIGQQEEQPPSYQQCKIDLGKFSYDNFSLGEKFPEDHYLFQYLSKAECYISDKDGFEIGIKEGKFDYLFLTIEQYKENLYLNENQLFINKDSSPEDITYNFGSPYWIDEDDKEIILFYEYKEGKFELQFEFSNKENLSYITLMQNGILSEESNRKSYRINKEWPPKG